MVEEAYNLHAMINVDMERKKVVLSLFCLLSMPTSALLTYIFQSVSNESKIGVKGDNSRPDFIQDNNWPWLTTKRGESKESDPDRMAGYMLLMFLTKKITKAHGIKNDLNVLRIVL